MKLYTTEEIEHSRAALLDVDGVIVSLQSENARLATELKQVRDVLNEHGGALRQFRLALKEIIERGDRGGRRGAK